MKIIKNFIIIFLFFTNHVLAENSESFKKWLNDFKNHALENNISESTFDMALQMLFFYLKL